MTHFIRSLFFFITASFPLIANCDVILLDRIAAVVDDDTVMKSELDDRVANFYNRIAASGTEAPPRETMVPRILEQLIIERIQIDKGINAGIKISDAQVNQAIEKMAGSQGITIEQLVEKAHQDGITLATLRRELRNEMIIRQVQEALVGRRIRVTDQEVTNFLNSEEGQYWSSPDMNIGHILIPLSPAADAEAVAEAQAKVDEIYRELQAGTDFRQLAITYSSGQNALQGGDWGWRKATQLPPVFVKALEGVPDNGVSQAIRSDAGFHILKLYGKRGAEKQLVQQNKVRHILIKPTQIRSEEDTRKMLSGIREDILAGADFAELAKQYSEDIGSALSGGDLGWSVPGQFVPEFEQVMNEIKVGDVSEPFRSQFGWHILQVTERRSQDFSDDIKSRQARNILFQRKYEEELPLWLQQIREEAYVDIKI